MALRGLFFFQLANPITTLQAAPWWARPSVLYRLTAAPAGPIDLELPESKAVTVTYADLVKHAGGREVAAVSCVPRTFTRAAWGGAQMPNGSHLYTGVPRLITLWPGDAITFTAVKTGGMEMGVMLPVYVGERALPQSPCST